MKVILVLCSTLAVALAGVGQLNQQDEQNILQMFHQICGQGQTEMELNGMTIYCKSARDDFQETITHQVRVPPSPGQGRQVIFVQPPFVRYQHNIQLLGSAGQGQQSKIYVLPQRATHQISANYNPGPSTQVKPVVYFLNNRENQQQGQGPPQQQQPQPEYGVVNPGQPQPQPQRPQYGAPPQQQYGPAPQAPQGPPQGYGYGGGAQEQRPQSQYGAPEQRPQYGAPQQPQPQAPQQYGTPQIPVHVSIPESQPQQQPQPQLQLQLQPQPHPQYAPTQEQYVPQGYRYTFAVPDSGDPAAYY